MPVRIELYGLPRHWAGVAEVEVEAATLGEALRELCRRAPQLERICLADGRMSAGCVVNRNGLAFISDPATPLADGDCLIVLSSDAGG